PAALARHIRKLLKRPGGTVLGVGVGVPGLVDHSGRQVTVALSHDWHGVDLAEQLEQAVELPVTLANRAQVAALGHVVPAPASGEEADGTSSLSTRIGAPSQDLVYLYLGNGVISGIVIGGRLHFGHDGTAGDLGH